MFNDAKLDAESVAYLIQNSPEYIGGNQKVILYSCETGKEPNGFAQKLSNILGVVVEAPNAEIRPKKTGGFLVGYVYKEGGQYHVDRGRMNTFKPQN